MKFLLAGAFALGLAGSASAASLQFGAGDKDCFGLGGVCAPGDRYNSDLGGQYFGDNSNHGDAVGTDFWDIGPRDFLFRINVGSDSVVAATLKIFVAGAELAQGLTVRFGDTVVGQILASGGDAHEAAGLYSFALNPAHISSLARIRLSPTDINEAYIVDHVEIDLETEPVATVPVPAGLPLLGAALGLTALLRRRKAA